MEFIKKISYHITVNPEEIQSPLPPRKVEIPPVPTTSSSVIKDQTTISQQIQKQQERGLKKYLIWLIAAVIILLIILLLVYFRGRGKTPVSNQIELNYWGLWEESSVMDGIITDFEAKNPNIKVNYKKNSQENYKLRLQNKLAKTETSGETDTPDIFRIHVSWLPLFKNELAPVPTETANRIGLETDFYKVFSKTLKTGSNYKAIPLMYDGLALFYNKDLIGAVGGELPKTWNDLRIIAEKITKRDEQTDKIITAGAALGSANNIDHWSDIIGLMLKQGGINPLLNSDDEKIKSVLVYYSLYRTKYHLWDETLPPSTLAFANGSLGFYFGPSWRIFNLRDINPKLNYEVISVPQLENENGTLTNVNWASFWVEGVNTKSKHQKEAFKLLEFLASKEALQKSFTLASQIRDFGQISPRKSMFDQMGANSKIKPFVDAAETADNWYLSSRTFDESLNDEMIKYFGDAINAIVNQNKDAAEVIITLRSGINQLKTKYGL